MSEHSIDAIAEQAIAAVETAVDEAALEAVRVHYLGKKGVVSLQMRTLGSLPPEERKAFGAAVNAVKEKVSAALEQKKTLLEAAALKQQLQAEQVDVSLPVRPETKGSLHPISAVMEEVVQLFSAMGFVVAEGPEIEDDFHNFTALNIPENHPARQMHDTFYFPQEGEGEAHLLRTHTSSVQIRYMEEHKPPLRILVPGRAYRCDYDLTHTPMFHQIEGLVIEKNITMAHLKGCLQEFMQRFFEVEGLPVRFRPSFFPFTEPSAEMDIGCAHSREGLVIGGGDDWMEVLGCGMVHPNVLRHVGLDPEAYQGMAFGMGLERLAMLKYNIPDLRTFFEGDVRWLHHYGFSPAA